MLAAVLFSAVAAYSQVKNTGDSDGYCWGAMGSGDNWCWLTWDGLEFYAEGASVKGGCGAFKDADADYYCENANKPDVATPAHTAASEPDGAEAKTCACAMGGSHNGGKAPGANGLCGHYCSAPHSGVRHCGAGKDYKTGDFHDCTDTQEGESKAAEGSPLDGYLAELRGKTDVDCGQVCSAVDKSYQGYGMSSSGEVATWGCKCSGEKVNVACVGSPFMECCKDECKAGKCGDSPGGWECPKGGGCPSGHCTGNWEEWVAAHNIFRCMHDVPPLVWGEEVFQDCKSTFQNQAAMEHSHCYDVAAPAGPAGENLYKSSWHGSPLDSVQAWYTEVADCGPMPGCSSGASGTVGHFTAMIWNGAREIGCLTNSHNLGACRYKGEDFASCNTPNYGGSSSYPQNVFARVKTYAECSAAVTACGLTVGTSKDAPDATTGLVQDQHIQYDVPATPRPMVNGVAPGGAASTALVAVAAVTLVGLAAYARGVRREPAAADAEELLERAEPMD